MIQRLVSVFRKSLLEQIRSPLELSMILLLGPAFVLLYWLFFGGGSTSYSLLVLNQDTGARGAQMIQSIGGLAYPGGQPILRIHAVKDRSEAEKLLRNRDASALLVIPKDFTDRLAMADAAASAMPTENQSPASGTPLTLSGDLTNPTYSVAAALTYGVIEEYLRAATHQARPIELVEQPLGGSGLRTEFETYIPGLLVVSIVMMLFSAAINVAREVESGGLKRLALTRVTSFEYLGGVSGVQLLVSFSAVGLTFLTAVMLGFHSQGPLWLAVVTGALTAFSVIGVGLIVAAFSRSTTEAFIIANFPMLLLMFFSGGVFPIQRIPLFTLGGRSFALFDLLPQTHAVLALNKILTLGAGLGDVTYELGMVLLLSLAYFAFGVWIFGRRVMK